MNFKLKDKKSSDLLTRIASDYSLFGTLLLNDEDGTVIETIKQSNHHDPEAITREIFRRWFYSSDMLTWKALVDHLREAKLNTVANDIESMYNVDVKDKSPPTQASSDAENPEAKRTGKHLIRSMKELVKSVADIGNWEALCTNLEVDHGTMSELIYSTEQVSSKKLRCLQAYFDNGEASWEDVIQAVFDPPIRNRRVAKKIAQTQGIDFNKLVKDEL